MADDDRNNEDDEVAVNGGVKGRNLLRPADFDGEIEGLREDLLQERDRHLRTLADFKNYRRRVESEGNKRAEAGKREMLLLLLGIADDMENALRWTGKGKRPVAEGLNIIYQKLLALLEAQGVRSFDSKGKVFTPDLHEAVALAEGEDVEKGTVVEELRRGYLWRNELLRPAQVRVAG